MLYQSLGEHYAIFSLSVDDSLMYRGQMFYLHKSLNEWQVKFIVVKNIDVFAEVYNTC